MKIEYHYHVRAFAIKYHGPTCFKGARVSIHDQRNNVRRYVPYDYAIGNVLEQGWTFLEGMGIKPTGHCILYGGTHLVLTDDFTTHILGSKQPK